MGDEVSANTIRATHKRSVLKTSFPVNKLNKPSKKQAIKSSKATTSHESNDETSIVEDNLLTANASDENSKPKCLKPKAKDKESSLMDSGNY